MSDRHFHWTWNLGDARWDIVDPDGPDPDDGWHHSRNELDARLDAEWDEDRDHLDPDQLPHIKGIR